MNIRSMFYRRYVSFLIGCTLFITTHVSAVPGLQWLFFMGPKAIEAAPKVLEIVFRYGKDIVVTLPNAVKVTLSCAGVAGAGALLKDSNKMSAAQPSGIKPLGLEQGKSPGIGNLSKLQTPSSTQND